MIDLGWMRRAAEVRSGLSDWGDDASFWEGCETLVASVRADVEPHLMGRTLIRRLLARTLRDRLQFVGARTSAGELERPRRPIVIASMPRTGTTLLQRMLAADPAAMSLPLWLLLDPMPPPRGGPALRLKRFRAHVELRALRAAAPSIDVKHHPDPDAPEECTYLFMSTGLSLQFYALWPVLGYARWAIAQDASSAYRQYAEMLSLYQRELTGERWVLKSPMHFLALRELCDVLPEARIVQLHRDPAVALPSLHSLFRSTHDVVSSRYDAGAIAAMTTEVLAERADRVVTLRESAPRDRFCDVHYAELVRDPVGTARRIYEQFALDWTPEVERTATAIAAERPAQRYGRHRYSLEQFGQTRAEVEQRFARYIECFGIRPETSHI